MRNILLFHGYLQQPEFTGHIERNPAVIATSPFDLQLSYALHGILALFIVISGLTSQSLLLELLSYKLLLFLYASLLLILGLLL